VTVFARRSRTADPVTDAGLQGLTVGAWGMIQTIIVMVVGTAGLATAALYLHSGQPAWPPEGITAPGIGYSLVAVGFAVASCVAVLVARVRLLDDARPDTAVGLLATAGSLAAAIAALVADLRALDFRWDEHAYTSLYWVLVATAVVYLGVALLLVVTVLLQRLAGLLDPVRMLELDNVVLWVLFSAVATAGLLFLVHWLPVVHTPDGVGVPQVGPGSGG
jgi:heme/copper-type cytochrome/quinol oxidase subunit 3